VREKERRKVREEESERVRGELLVWAFFIIIKYQKD
jgi:hypothetical protein